MTAAPSRPAEETAHEQRERLRDERRALVAAALAPHRRAAQGHPRAREPRDGRGVGDRRVGRAAREGQRAARARGGAPPLTPRSAVCTGAMSANLAGILPRLGRARIPDRPALRLGDLTRDLRGARRRQRARRRAAARARRRGRATASAIMLPNVPRVRARPTTARCGSARSSSPMNVLQQAARGRVPAARRRRAADLRARRDARARRGRRGGDRRDVRPRHGRRVPGGAAAPALDELADAARGRHRDAALHLGHDREPEGRRAHALQPAPATPRSPRAVRPRPRGRVCSACCRCSTPSARPAGSTRRCTSGACADAAAALRPRAGARAARRARGDALPRRPDDVRGDARPRRRRASRPGGCATASRAARRCR